MSFRESALNSRCPGILLSLGIGLLAVLKPLPGHASERSTEVMTELLTCDDSMKGAFNPDNQTSVLLVERVHKGQPFPNLTMEQLVYPKVPATYGADMCHVKLLVGPPGDGPADAPSTSRGMAIEIWLPEKSAWNGRFHAIGGSGSTGSEEGVPDRISSWTGSIDTRSAPRVAAEEGAVTSTTDSGKGNDRSSSFLMNPDGSVNNRAVHDYTTRAPREQAVKTKALIKAYYGTEPRYSYFDGASGGGRQALHVAQNVPEQYDGILSGVPALAWNAMITNAYPSLVILRDLDGKPMTREQLDLVSNAAIVACDMVDGKHMGFVVDNRSCRYDPLKDKAVICASDGGANGTPACVNRKQALAINKMWYGMTIDGSVPDPALDNGWDAPLSGKRLWYGQPRGTDLVPFAQTDGMPIGNDMIAVALGDPKYGAKDFVNATGRGQNAWKAFSYEELAAAFIRVQAILPDLNATNPDISAFKTRGGKLIHVAHANDNPLISQGSIDYYERVLARMGGAEAVRSFYRFYYVPGLGHGPSNGTANPTATPPTQAKGQMYRLLTDWVEKGIEPGRIVFSSSALTGNEAPRSSDEIVARVVQETGKVEARKVAQAGPYKEISLPVCAWPDALKYLGGDMFKAESYVCERR